VRVFPETGVWLLGSMAAALGLAAAAAYARWRPARRFATWLAVAPIAAAAIFFFDGAISKVRGDGGAPHLPLESVTATAPIVWIVFDELPLTSLLDAERAIDAGRYPNFAALAAGATWFRNTTTIAEETAMALPAILTGRYPDGDQLPIAADHPANLFSLLDGDYAIHAHEVRTMLYAGSGKRGEERPGDGLYADLAILFAHMVAPADVASQLPTISEDWRDFAAPHPDELARIQAKANYGDRLAEFDDFLRDVAPCVRPCLYFAHVVLPHVPWQYTPSGKLYQAVPVYGIQRPEGRWGSDDWWVLQGYQRHLFQVALVDRLLGRLIARLEQSDLYDRALVVVTADHGAAFWPGTSRRVLEGHPHPGDILRVPFLVKAPNQRRGEIRDDPIETVDVLPTVVDLLGIRLPWEIDGVSVAAPGFAGRDRRVGFGMKGERIEYAAAAVNIEASLERKLAAFGSEGEGLFGFGRFGGLVGRRVGELARSPAAGLTVKIASEPFALAGHARRFSPARVTGRFELWSATTGGRHVAVSHGRTIRAVGPTYRVGLTQRAFSLLVPEDVFGPSRVDARWPRPARTHPGVRRDPGGAGKGPGPRSGRTGPLTSH
jgi:hypothetical protein